MISTYLPILLLLGVAIVMPIGMLVVSTTFGPKVKAAVKFEPYECGVAPQSSANSKIPVKYYRVAILFVLFDVEAALLFPWAVIFRSKVVDWGALFLIGEAAIFMLILAVGYLYAWNRGALEWD